jgi:hypothetical protein
MLIPTMILASRVVTNLRRKLKKTPRFKGASAVKREIMVEFDGEYWDGVVTAYDAKKDLYTCKYSKDGEVHDDIKYREMIVNPDGWTEIVEPELLGREIREHNSGASNEEARVRIAGVEKMNAFEIFKYSLSVAFNWNELDLNERIMRIEPHFFTLFWNFGSVGRTCFACDKDF